MICKNCGTEIKEGEGFCPVCGAKVESLDAATDSTLQPTLTRSIVALIFSDIPILGLILGIIARNKMKKYYAAGGADTGKAKAAKIIALIAFIVGIVSIVSLPFYIIGGTAYVSILESFMDF